MTIWFLTVGNSDVLLNTHNNWNALERQAKAKYRELPHFRQSEVSSPSGKTLWAFPARSLGLVYADQLETYGSDLEFPRLDALCQEFETGDRQPTRIIALLTDQTHLFDSSHRKQNSPYWQDTCTVQPVLECYLSRKFPHAKQEYRVVRPQVDAPGLDHWNNTLPLIQDLLADIEHKPNEIVYVSHQGGTPALSSAVQFVTLTQFGARVQFLVSNEFAENSSEVILSLTYLQGIRLQEAKRLLSRYDYIGVKELFAVELKEVKLAKVENIQKLLDCAVLWNCAQFKQFAERLGDEAKARLSTWWWTAYESAYLAVIRLEQNNTVEAMFHSFRAVEGVMGYWAIQHYPNDVEERNGKPVAKLHSGSQLPQYLINDLNDPNKSRNGEMELYGERLFKLFRESRPDLRDHEDLKVIWKSARNRRNQLFHQLLGLDEKDVFQAWGRANQSSWEARLLNCLNLITGQSQFKSIKQASLMAKVHEALESAILTPQFKGVN